MAKPLQPVARVSMRRSRLDRYPVWRALFSEQRIVARLFRVSQPSLNFISTNDRVDRAAARQLSIFIRVVRRSESNAFLLATSWFVSWGYFV